MPTDVLPGFSYSRDVGRYRSNETGRFVARERILELLEVQTDGAERLLGELTTAAHEGRLSPSVWAEQMRTEVRRLHLQQAALGAGGFDRLTQSDYGRIGGTLRAEYANLEQFAQALQNGEVTLPQALNRVRGYVGGARRQFWNAERDRRRPGVGTVLIEKRVLDEAARHCRDCPGYAQRGWQLVGELPVPGERCQCGHHCRCSMRQMEIPADELSEWVGTYR